MRMIMNEIRLIFHAVHALGRVNLAFEGQALGVAHGAEIPALGLELTLVTGVHAALLIGAGVRGGTGLGRSGWSLGIRTDASLIGVVAAPEALLLGAVLVFASAAREDEFPRFVRLELIGTAGVFGNVISNGHTDPPTAHGCARHGLMGELLKSASVSRWVVERCWMVGS